MFHAPEHTDETGQWPVGGVGAYLPRDGVHHVGHAAASGRTHKVPERPVVHTGVPKRPLAAVGKRLLVVLAPVGAGVPPKADTRFRQESPPESGVLASVPADAEDKGSEVVGATDVLDGAEGVPSPKPGARKSGVPP